MEITQITAEARPYPHKLIRDLLKMAACGTLLKAYSADKLTVYRSVETFIRYIGNKVINPMHCSLMDKLLLLVRYPRSVQNRFPAHSNTGRYSKGILGSIRVGAHQQRH